MPNLKITLEYDGTNYNGWQRQKNTRRTIQQIVENSLYRILHQKIKLIAAGRTDAGVHAKAQVANFQTSSKIPLPKLRYALNSLLPPEIKVSRIAQVSCQFHSQYDAYSKTYVYTILNRAYPSVFLRNQVYFYPGRLNVRLMQKASRYLIGKHNFSAFKNGRDSENKSSVRHIQRIRIKKEGDFIYLEFTADGFLRNMVRNIVGTLIEVGRGKITPPTVKEILLSRNRKLAGPTVSACGLCLLKVRY